MKRVAIALSALVLLSGCGIIRGGNKPKTPTVGERIAVLQSEASIEVDPLLASTAILLPPAVENADWAQPGGNAAKSLGHVALGSALGEAWSVSIGEGSGKRVRLAAAPVVAAGKVFTIDADAVVRAFSVANGAQVWSAQLAAEDNQNRSSLFGGGVTFDDGRLYVTNGLGYAGAMNAETGALIWRVRPGGPLRGSPTISNDNVYVVSQDNQLFALNPANGSLRWRGSGAIEQAGVFGMAAPAGAQGTVVVGYSSGELSAYRYENGQSVWQDALTRTSISTAVASLSDIDAYPVIDQGRVYSIGQGGRMVAIELNTGQRVWEINVAGRATPWVAGEWIYVVTDQAQLLAVARATGHIKWMTQLPRYRDEEDKKGPISWVGPVLAGDRLILASTNGYIANVSPLDGAIQSTVRGGTRFVLPPVVAGKTLYLLGDDGRLSAWR